MNDDDLIKKLWGAWQGCNPWDPHGKSGEPMRTVLALVREHDQKAHEEKIRRRVTTPYRPPGCDCDPSLKVHERCSRSWIRCNGALKAHGDQMRAKGLNNMGEPLEPSPTEPK